MIPYLENREDLAALLSTADLAIIPSRSEGFGLTALEALSAGLPFLVTQTSGFGEALQVAYPQSTPWIVDSEEWDNWAEAIKSVREKGREASVAECQTLRENYGKKYIWESQCRDLVEKMVSLANGKHLSVYLLWIVLITVIMFEGLAAKTKPTYLSTLFSYEWRTLKKRLHISSDV